MVMSLVELTREVIQNPVQYRRLYDFFVPLAGYFSLKRDTEESGSGIISFITQKLGRHFKKKAA